VTSSAASAAAVLDPAPRALATAARTGDTAPHTAVEKPGSGVKLLNVQALRAIAALSVVFCHLGSADGLEEKYLQGRTLMRFYATPGQMGVDLFFVISGFIMTVTTWNLVTSRATSRKFFVRRVKRIYPIYWVLTAPVLAIWLFNSDLVNPGAAHASQPIQSLLLLPQAGDPFIAAGWTLVFEMYFYAVFSLVLLAPRRFIPWIVGAWATVTLVFGIFFYLQWHLPVVYVVSNPMVLEFVFGIVVGYVIMQRRKFPALPTLLLGTVALITAMVLIGRKGDIGLDSWQRMAFAGIPCAFILAGAVGLERSKRFVAPHIMQVLGDSSYAIYLVHGLVFALAGRAIIHVVPDSLNKPLHIPLMLGVAAGATLIGVAIHYWIERPLLVRIGGRRAPALQPAVSPAAS
jgi:exopolysaccharide production protein ExoZ